MRTRVAVGSILVGVVALVVAFNLLGNAPQEPDVVEGPAYIAAGLCFLAAAVAIGLGALAFPGNGRS